MTLFLQKGIDKVGRTAGTLRHPWGIRKGVQQMTSHVAMSLAVILLAYLAARLWLEGE